MKKARGFLALICLLYALGFAGCAGNNADLQSSSPRFTSNPTAAEQSNITTKPHVSDSLASNDGTTTVNNRNETGTKAGKKTTPAVTTQQTVSGNTTTAPPNTPNTKPEAIARFKLYGGKGDLLLKDMDNKGFIGSCKMEYTNTQTNEKIRNYEWKTDGKFANYFNALHLNTTIYFDSTVDAQESIRSAALKTEVPFTVGAWVYPSSTYKQAGSTDFRVIAAYNSNNQIDHWDLKLMSNNELSFHYTGIPAGQSKDSGFIVPADKWSHVAVTVAADKITYYVNGKAVKTNPITSEMNEMYTKGNFSIGALNEGAYSFRGGIAEVCIFKGVADPKDTTGIKW